MEGQYSGGRVSWETFLKPAVVGRFWQHNVVYSQAWQRFHEEQDNYRREKEPFRVGVISLFSTLLIKGLQKEIYRFLLKKQTVYQTHTGVHTFRLSQSMFLYLKALYSFVLFSDLVFAEDFRFLHF